MQPYDFKVKARSHQIKIAADWLQIQKLVWKEPYFTNVTKLHFTSLKPVGSQSEASRYFNLVWMSH